MERNLNHDDFDQFLKDNADGLRMRPSDRVWKNIEKELDRKKRRFGGFFALTLLLMSGTYIIWELATADRIPVSAYPNNTIASKQIIKAPAEQPAITQAPVIAFKHPKATGTTAQITTLKTGIKVGQPSTAAVNTPSQALSIPAATPVVESMVPETVSQTIATPETLLAAARSEGQLGSQLSHTAPQVATLQEKAVVQTNSRRSRKLSWQVFATPTISYRKLADNKAYQRPILTTSIPANFSALYGINDAVIHKPDLGLEFGVMARIPISRNLRFRTGFQFNVSRYDIKAFSYVPEVATIALNNGARVDSVRAVTNYRNFTGGRTNWLQNFYFQASMPIGLELKVAGNKQVSWGVASSVQPTYVIGDRAYLITADYKNYARVPWLTRRWNMNTNLETFVTLNSGKTQWQIGPQVRYQVLSSFISEYPVRENLFDFGMKVGVTLK